ncbi:hypothetical protein V6W59_03100 [Mannheimia sp. HC-2023]|uniref:hypothetical protein n=1 Tax=Mannheimia indoligenes TaxID=3103145 RepID=UPI002FE6607B
MTDTERLDFIEKHKLYPYWSDAREQWIIGTYEINGGYFHWARNTYLRTAIDDAMAEMRGLRNAPTN